jgi:hypothetical protein
MERTNSPNLDRESVGLIPRPHELKAEKTLNHNPSPGPNGEADLAAEPDVQGTTGAPAARHAAAAKAPAKATKKPLIDPAKYRSAKAPAADEMFSDGAQTTIPVRKPGKLNFFRVHPDEEYRLYNVPVVEDDKRDTHIVAAELEVPEDLQRFVSNVNLVTCINPKGTLFLWPFKNSTNDWSRSASRIVRRAVGEWVRLRADMDASCYRLETAPAELRAIEPEWPKMTFEEILNTAFEDKCIDSLDHPVIRSLRGLSYGAAF